MKVWRLYFQTLSECRKYLMKDFRRPLTISHGSSTSIVAWIVRNYIAESPMVQGENRCAAAAAYVVRSHVSLFISAGTVVPARSRAIDPRTILLRRATRSCYDRAFNVSIWSVLQIWNTYYYTFRKNRIIKLIMKECWRTHEELYMRWEKDFGLS